MFIHALKLGLSTKSWMINYYIVCSPYTLYQSLSCSSVIFQDIQRLFKVITKTMCKPCVVVILFTRSSTDADKPARRDVRYRVSRKHELNIHKPANLQLFGSLFSFFCTIPPCHLTYFHFSNETLSQTSFSHITY